MKRGKRYLAALMIVAMVFANVGPGVWAALSGTEKEVLFEIEATDLIGEIEEAAAGRLEMGDVEYESIDGEAGMFWETFTEGGGVYELNPEIRGGRDGVGLRLFVRLPDLAEDLEESYRVTGEEEILLLYTNETPDTVRCRMKVNRMGEDGGAYIRVTKEVALSGYQSFLDGEELPEEERETVRATGSDAGEGEGPGADMGGGPGDEKELAGSENVGEGEEEGAGPGAEQEGVEREFAGNGPAGSEAAGSENVGNETAENSQETEKSNGTGGDPGTDEDRTTGEGPGEVSEKNERTGAETAPEIRDNKAFFTVRAAGAGGEPIVVEAENSDSALEEGALIAPENEILSVMPKNKQETTEDVLPGNPNPGGGGGDTEESPDGEPEQGMEIPEPGVSENFENGEDTGMESGPKPEQEPENPEPEEKEGESNKTLEAGDPAAEESGALDPATGSNAEQGDGEGTDDQGSGIVEAGKATDSNGEPTATDSNAGEYGEVSSQVGVDEMATARLCRMTLRQLIPSLEKQCQYMYEGEGIYVLVELPEDNKVPAGAKLWVERVTEERDPDRLARRRSQFAEAYGGDGEALDLYDIGFYVRAEEAGALLESDTDAGTSDGTDTKEADIPDGEKVLDREEVSDGEKVPDREEVPHQVEAEPRWERLSVPDGATIYMRFTGGLMEVENAVSVVRFGEESPRPRMLGILDIKIPYVNQIESLTFFMEDLSEFGIYKRGLIRHTGGAGTGLYRAAGMLLMLGAGWILACQELYGKMAKNKED